MMSCSVGSVSRTWRAKHYSYALRGISESRLCIAVKSFFDDQLRARFRKALFSAEHRPRAVPGTSRCTAAGTLRAFDELVRLLISQAQVLHAFMRSF